MERTLKEAVEANDIVKIRKALTNIIINDSGKTIPIESVTEVLETTNGLFEPDDGKQYPESAAKLTDQQVRQLIRDLNSNFSIEKFSLLTEFFALKANESGYKFDPDEDDTAMPGEASSDNDDMEIVIEERTVMVDGDDRKPVTRAERDEMISDAKAAWQQEGESCPKKCNCGRIVSAIIMALGCAAAIVGICVPVNFLIGLGIGVLMVGAAALYMNIQSSRS